VYLRSIGVARHRCWVQSGHRPTDKASQLSERPCVALSDAALTFDLNQRLYQPMFLFSPARKIRRDAVKGRAMRKQA
jgi:hypothetical protein